MQLPIRITGEARASSLKASACTIKPALTFSARGSLQLTSVSQCQSYLQDLYFVEKEALFPLRQLYAEDTPLCQNLVALLLRQSTNRPQDSRPAKPHYRSPNFPTPHTADEFPFQDREVPFGSWLPRESAPSFHQFHHGGFHARQRLLH